MKTISYSLFILFLCLILFSSLYFLHTSSFILLSTSSSPKKEGMSNSSDNTSFTYVPSIHKTDKNKTIQMNHLRYETDQAFTFFKELKGLIHQPPPAKPPTIDSPPAVSPAEAEAAKKDEADTNSQLKDMEDKLESMIDMTNYTREYSKDVNTSELYKTYSRFVTNITEELDKEFADIFNSVNIENNALDTFSHFKEAVAYYNTAFNYTKYFLIQPINRKKYNPNEFTSYFVSLMEKYSSKQSALDEIKQKFYTLIQPTYLFQRLCAYYKENKKMYSSRDDALLIVNIAKQTIHELQYDALKPTRDKVVFMVDVDKEDRVNAVLDLNTIQYTDIACIVYQIVLFIAYNVNEHFGMDFNDFKKRYAEYMKKQKVDSFYLFLMEHPPQLNEL